MKAEELLKMINTADREALQILPGVGEALADRLISGRPYTALEDAAALRGVSAAMLERWSLAEGPSAPAAEEKAEAAPAPSEQLRDRLDDLGEAAAERISDWRDYAAEQTQSARRALGELPDRIASHPQGGLLKTIFAGTLLVLISLLLSLAVIGTINGSLRFASRADFRALQNGADRLGEHLGALQIDLDAQRQRLDILDGIGDRTVLLEDAQQQMVAEVEAISLELAAAAVELQSLGEEVALQSERSGRFESFLESLHTLLNQLFSTQGETQ